MAIPHKKGLKSPRTKKWQQIEYIPYTQATIDKKRRTLCGMPKSASNLVRTMPKRKAVRNAPKLSIKKSLFGFKMNLLSSNRNFFGTDYYC
jgi:hypothetical protein